MQLYMIVIFPLCTFLIPARLKIRIRLKSSELRETRNHWSLAHFVPEKKNFTTGQKLFYLSPLSTAKHLVLPILAQLFTLASEKRIKLDRETKPSSFRVF